MLVTRKSKKKYMKRIEADPNSVLGQQISELNDAEIRASHNGGDLIKIIANKQRNVVPELVLPYWEQINALLEKQDKAHDQALFTRLINITIRKMETATEWTAKPEKDLTGKTVYA